MKATDARRLRRARDAQREARERGLEEFLRTGERTEAVIPELIPDESELKAATREVLRLVRVCERTPRGRKARKLDELRAAMRRLVYAEKVMALDPVERAGLTPARLTMFQAGITADDVGALYRRMAGDSSLVTSARDEKHRRTNV